MHHGEDVDQRRRWPRIEDAGAALDRRDIGSPVQRREEKRE
jgi:hypothetical protein